MPNPQPQTVYRQGLGGMDAWTRHQHFIENYVKFYNDNLTPQEAHGITERDILRENHRFLRSEADDEDLTWERRIAKKYYDKLFKEYALVELKYYKEGRIAMRWRNQKEVVSGKGQFTCGNLRCDEAKGLESWEINFGYLEQGEKKNALVKVRLCEKCSYKLNYKTTHKRANTNQEDELTSSSSATSTAPTATATAPSKQRSQSSSRDRVTKANASESSRRHSSHHESSTRSKRKDRGERDTEFDAKSSRHHHRDDRESSKRRKPSSRRDEDKTDDKDRVNEAERSRSSSSSSSLSHREHRRSHSTGDGHDKQDVRERWSHSRSKSDGGRERSSRSDVKDGRGANYERYKEATDANRTAVDREVAVEKSHVKRDKDQASVDRPSSTGEFERFFKGLFE
ncbi:MAG: folate-sensitive fragile site protein Fra10Ac1-domain-containing protein [Linnemannia gamsii]|nr:MAG: folate-sensitive fragile site protein Fra10Ac1-domain-containing protein [Linnemannia gamsii]